MTTLINHLVEPALLREIDEKRLIVEAKPEDLRKLVMIYLENDALISSALLEAGPSRKEQKERKKKFREANQSLVSAWEYAKGKFNGILDHNLILETAKRVDKANEGAYRSDNMRLQGDNIVMPVNGDKVSEQMDVLTLFANDKRLHPVAKAGLLHLHFVRIHPLPEGNGRTSRLLQNLVLDAEGYAPVDIKKGEKMLYQRNLKEALRGFYERENIQTGKHDERFLSALTNAPPITESESRFLDYIATKVNMSADNLITEIDTMPKYRVVLEGNPEPGQIFAVKNAIRSYLSKLGRPGQVNLLRERGSMEISGNLTQEDIASTIGKNYGPSFKIRQIR